MTGTVLANRYTIHEKLGTGGMATVYRAHCAYLQREVAIKFLRREYREDAELVRRFESEARAAASLTHPNIVQIYDVGKEGGIDYIVMELVDGRSLKELLEENGPMPWQMAVDVMIKVVSALQRAHAKKIVHRDIKPQNILLTSDGEPKVADFGIARIASTGMETMKVDTVASVHYASPEQVRGGYTDAQSDLYSAGVTLYEMLTGELPFKGDNPVSVALRHIQDAIPRADALVADLPGALADVVEKCMQKNRVDRYPDAASLIADLEQVKQQPDTAAVLLPADRPGLANVAVVQEPLAGIVREELEVPIRKHPVDAQGTHVHDPSLDLMQAYPKEEREMAYRKSRSASDRRRHGSTSRKLIYPLLYLGLIAIIIALIAGIIRFVSEDLGTSPETTPSASNSAPGRQEFLVGAYKGKALEEVLAGFPEGLQRVVHYIEDATVPKDHVIRQNPMAGSKIVVGGLTTLELFVSTGTETVVVPEIRGLLPKTLMAELQDQLGLKVEQKFEYSEEWEAERVIRLDPAPGEELPKGSVITMVISLGKEQKQVSMPDLTNMDRKTAEAMLAEYQLEVGTVTPAQTPQTGMLLLTQSIRPGNLVMEGTTVDLAFEEPVVETTPPPDPSGTPVPSDTPMPTDSGPTLAKVTIPVDWQEEWTGESVQMTVVVIVKESGFEEMILDAKIRKEDFPYPVLITIPDGGGTVKIYVNGTLHKEKPI